MKTYLFLAAVMVLGGMPADAQPGSALTAARVTLVAGAEPSKEGRTEVVRQAARSPQNVVLVHRNASADDLAAALAMLNALRRQFGDSLAHDLRASPEHVRHGANWEGSAYRRWLNEQLVRLRQAPDRELGVFGTVKAVQITLPPPTGTITSSRGSE
jgi:hypothetical protein